MTIDAHLHTWDLDRGTLRWLEDAPPSLQRTFSADAAHRELVANEVSSAILVQAEDSTAETDHLLAVAIEHDWVAGVVGWIDLANPRAAEAQLESARSTAKLRGVRSLIHAYHDSTFLRQAAVRRTAEMLAERRLVLEIPDAWPDHLDAATTLAANVPELTVVIDHLGKPPLSGQLFNRWQQALARVAALPNAYAKLSGLRLDASPSSTPELKVLWEIGMDLFSAERLMWGSDWPMISADGVSYSSALDQAGSVAATLAASERHAIFEGTARRVYQLD